MHCFSVACKDHQQIVSLIKYKSSMMENCTGSPPSVSLARSQATWISIQQLLWTKDMAPTVPSPMANGGKACFTLSPHWTRVDWNTCALWTQAWSAKSQASVAHMWSLLLHPRLWLVNVEWHWNNGSPKRLRRASHFQMFTLSFSSHGQENKSKISIQLLNWVMAAMK